VGPLAEKGRTIRWEGRGVMCEKLALLRLSPPPVSIKDRWVGPHEQVLNVPIISIERTDPMLVIWA
jgi:hypothetical protein